MKRTKKKQKRMDLTSTNVGRITEVVKKTMRLLSHDQVSNEQQVQ